MSHATPLDGLTEQPVAPPQPGDLLGGKYRLLHIIGRGGAAVVFEAEHVDLQTRCAIKIPHSHLVDGQQILRLQQEAWVGAQFNLPGLVQVLDYFPPSSTQGNGYLVMELLRGRSLADCSARELSAVDAARFAAQTLETLGILHRRGVIHRDLKPANLFLHVTVTGQVQVKILDFGLAKNPLELLGSSDGRWPMTDPGGWMGTLEYLSPEQAVDSSTVDARTDLYALGATLFELLTGHPIVANGPREERFRKALCGDVCRQPRKFQATVPLWLDQVVAKALNPARQFRYESAEEMRKALADGLATELLPAPTEAATQTRVPVRVTLQSALLVGALLCLIGLALLKPYSRPEDRPANRPAATSSQLADEMVLIPGGTFWIGSEPDEQDKALAECTRSLGADKCASETYNQEGLRHQVQLSAFYIDKHEATNNVVARILNSMSGLSPKEGGYVYDAEGELLLSISSSIHPEEVEANSGIIYHPQTGYSAHPQRGDHPVTQISWEFARRICAHQRKRLPTEAEWERAAGGPDHNQYPWGKDATPSLTCDGVVYGRGAGQACARKGPGPTQVGSNPADLTAEGLLDMAGNVSEWVNDTYLARHKKCDSACLNPGLGASAASSVHVIKGGSFGMGSYALRSATRSRSHRTKEYDIVFIDVGFRCARNAHASPENQSSRQ